MILQHFHGYFWFWFPFRFFGVEELVRNQIVVTDHVSKYQGQTGQRAILNSSANVVATIKHCAEWNDQQELLAATDDGGNDVVCRVSSATTTTKAE